VKPYSPANHTGTRNYRLLASKKVEVLIGEIERGEGALPHSHPGIEQVAYLLEGTAEVEVGSEKFSMRVGDLCFFPADVPHRFQATSEKVRVMVIYTPPYLEKPENVRRDAK
jgi:mannose-6-phosphate isomerase-like protein (cupin superfamily)